MSHLESHWQPQEIRLRCFPYQTRVPMAKQNKNVPEIILSERHIMHYLPASTQVVYWQQQQQIKNNVAKFHQVWSGEEEMTVCAAELK